MLWSGLTKTHAILVIAELLLYKLKLRSISDTQADITNHILCGKYDIAHYFSYVCITIIIPKNHQYNAS